MRLLMLKVYHMYCCLCLYFLTKYLYFLSEFFVQAQQLSIISFYYEQNNTRLFSFILRQTS